MSFVVTESCIKCKFTDGVDGVFGHLLPRRRDDVSSFTRTTASTAAFA